MQSPIVIPGRVIEGSFVPDHPLPSVDGPAELVVYGQGGVSAKGSIFDVVGRAAHPRSAEDIEAQIAEERKAWSGRNADV